MIQLNLPEKRYYKIGEVAKAFDINSSLIRFWDKEFDIINPKKNAKGNRMFTKEDIETLKLVYNLVKVRGFTIEGARNKLKKNQPKEVKNHEIISRLEKVKLELINIKNQLP